MAYTVLARRYRSQTFDEVVGQDAVTQTLKNAIESKRVAHAYLFSGTRGVGKTTLARVLAKSLNCLDTDEPTVSPCCKCDSCIAINTGEDLDVVEIDGASNNGVDNIRELRKNAIYRPARSRYKIYIIDEVHMLSTGAFNALLKILEEPPEHVKFIFATTEPNKVLATIQSRCQRFDFNSISPGVIGDQLKKVLKTEKVKSDDDLILHLSRLANGSMRDALSLLDQLISTGEEPLTVELLEEFLGEPNREKICSLLDRIGEKDAAEVLNIVDSLLKTGLTCIQITDSLIDCMRDLMVIISAGDNSELLMLTADERRKMVELAKKFDVAALIFSITTLEKLRWTIKNSESARALLEASMLRLALSEHFLGVESLLSRLKQGAVVSGGNVKKKLTASGASSAKPSQSVPAAAAPVIHGDINLDSIIAGWPEIVDSVRKLYPSLAGNLTAGKPVDFNGTILTVALTNEFNEVSCKNKSADLVKVMSACAGQSIRLKFEVAKDKSRTSSAAAAPADAVNSTKREEVLNDPALKTLIAGLNATVMNIEMKREE